MKNKLFEEFVNEVLSKPYSVKQNKNKQKKEKNEK
jgi:hypothetical protein